MNRRDLIRGGIGAAGFIAVAGFGPPACGVTKDKAVRYTDIAINYLTDLKPLLVQIGGSAIVALVDKAIPALQKLKEHLEDNDLPAAGNMWDTITNVLGQVATGLLQLPDSARRNTIIGIVTIVNVTLRTVKLFIESETPPSAMASVPATVRADKSDADKIKAAFEASRF